MHDPGCDSNNIDSGHRFSTNDRYDPGNTSNGSGAFYTLTQGLSAESDAHSQTALVDIFYVLFFCCLLYRIVSGAALATNSFILVVLGSNRRNYFYWYDRCYLS